ncbi:MAG: hypothetical protein M0R74_14710 [Dehalococcoidia bacterium]|nr:hypothetical protein [Dehalococcoidia bacterium]
MESCDCCAARRPFAVLRAVDAGDVRWQAAICASCLGWLRDVVTAARDDAPRLIASPTANGRNLLFEEQCRLCRRIAQSLSRIECRDPGGASIPFPTLRLCAPCDTWLGSVARDGRSPRHLRARAIDGAYGNWLHPNLRALTVAVDIADAAARVTVLQSCETMGITAGRVQDIDMPSVVILEVPGRALRAKQQPTLPRVLLAPLAARDDLRAALDPAVADWLTIPVTPQQVAAALTRVLLLGRQPRDWDHQRALPVLRVVEPMPPALVVQPAPAADVFEVAWLLRRFARGYDDLGVLAGEIVLVPRVPAERLSAVASRLRRLLGPRARVRSLVLQSHTPRLRASG